MKTKTLQRITSQNRTREVQRVAAEEREARELTQPWPFADDTELFDVTIRNSPEAGEYVIAATLTNGEVVTRARPAGTAYAEALRMGNRAQFGLFDHRRARKSDARAEARP